MRYAIQAITLSLLFIACHTQPLQPDIAAMPQEIEYHTLINHPLPITNDCPFEMVRINRFCIDRYEYPNIKGVYPDFAMSAFDAEKVCSDINKRLCSYVEWHRACGGSHGYYYSYGSIFKPGVCNDNKVYDKQPNWMLMFTPEWKAYARTLYKGEPSGLYPGCVTDEGVYDLPANVREWVKDGNQYVIPSGYWYGTMQGPSTCNYVIRSHSAGFASYEFGTRCCKSLTDDTGKNTSSN